MKYAFFLLILCNIVFYLWETGVGREKGDIDRYEINLPAAGERIVLLKELPEIPKKASAPPVKEAEIPAQPAVSPLPETAEPALTDSEPEAGAQRQAEAAPSRPDCFLLGPYPSESGARTALDRLKPRLEQVELVSRASEATDGYWVMYPKAENLDIARANRKMLMDKGVRDLWLFDKGDWQGAISLGLYKARERAEVVQRKFREQNIEVEVKPRLIRSEAFWLQIRWPGDRAELDGIVAKQAFEPQSPKLKPCD